MKSEFHRHDLLSEVILSYGIVPFVLGIFVVFLILRTMHRRHLRMRDPARRQMVLVGLSLVVGIGVTVMASNSALTTFPVNFFFWLVAGMVLTNMAAPEVVPEAIKERPVAFQAVPMTAPAYTPGGGFGGSGYPLPPPISLRPPAPAPRGTFPS